MEEVKVTLGSCTKFNFSTASEQDLIEFAAEHHFVSTDDIKILRKWREDPEGWGNTLES